MWVGGREGRFHPVGIAPENIELTQMLEPRFTTHYFFLQFTPHYSAYFSVNSFNGLYPIKMIL